MRKWGFIILACLLSISTVGCLAVNKPVFKNREQVKVERVVDGDTFEIVIGGKKEKARLIGVDTPETKKPNTPVMYYGKEASDYTKKRLEHKTVTLEWDIDKRDPYQRLLAMFGLEMNFLTALW